MKRKTCLVTAGLTAEGSEQVKSSRRGKCSTRTFLDFAERKKNLKQQVYSGKKVWSLSLPAGKAKRQARPDRWDKHSAGIPKKLPPQLDLSEKKKRYAVALFFTGSEYCASKS